MSTTPGADHATTTKAAVRVTSPASNVGPLWPTPDLAVAFSDQLREGETFKNSCALFGLPVTRVEGWMACGLGVQSYGSIVSWSGGDRETVDKCYVFASAVRKGQADFESKLKALAVQHVEKNPQDALRLLREHPGTRPEWGQQATKLNVSVDLTADPGFRLLQDTLVEVLNEFPDVRDRFAERLRERRAQVAHVVDAVAVLPLLPEVTVGDHSADDDDGPTDGNG